MADDQMAKAILALGRRLTLLAREDPELRNGLRRLASAILAASEEHGDQPDLESTEGTGETVVHTLAAGDDVEPIRPAPAEEPVGPSAGCWETAPGTVPAIAAPQLETRIEQQPPHVRTPPHGTSDEDLPAIEARCRLKAEGARWSSERRRLLDTGMDRAAEVAAADGELMRRADHEVRSYLWMNEPNFKPPADLWLLDQLGDCFEAVAESVALVRLVHGDLDALAAHRTPAVQMLAAAQSALKLAVDRLRPSADHDQAMVFDWLLRTTARERIRVERHMRLADPADPATAKQIATRVREIRKGIDEDAARTRTRTRLLGRLRFHAGLIAAGRSAPEDQDKVIDSVERLVQDGLPSSNPQLREVLLPIVDELPDADEVSPSFGLVLKELEGILASLPTTGERVPVREPAPEVMQVAKLLGGRAMVLIGGDRRRATESSLRESFDLSDLIWIETKKHQSVADLLPPILRQEVAVVLLLLRWASHEFRGVKPVCDLNGKPLVRVKGGYNPNRIARDIIEQASRQLADDRSTTDPGRSGKSRVS